MENLNGIFGKKVISLSEGKKVGYILDVSIDSKLKYLLGFIVADEESEHELFLPLANIVSQNEECVFIESSSDTQLMFDEFTNNPLGKMVYDRRGITLGKVVDLVILGSKIDKIITDKGEIKQKYIYSVGEDCLIFSTTKKKVDGDVSIFKDKSTAKRLPKIETMASFKSINSPIITSPIKLFGNSEMLLNKTATCDIFGFNNEILIKKGEIITKNKIEKLKKHGKLNYLIFNSK